MKINEPGVYQIVGSEIELLAIVVGEKPYLRITSAIIMNSAYQDAKFKKVKEESFEIQHIYNHPDEYVYFPYEGSEVCQLPVKDRSTRSCKMPIITDDMYNEFERRYISDTSIPGRGALNTKIYIMDRTGWTAAQAQLIICKIAKKVKNTVINLKEEYQW